MSIRARAPGKLVVLGEYAVLDGAEALVLAVNRHCRAELAASAGACRLTTRMAAIEESSFASEAASGNALVDLVRERAPLPATAWAASLDSSDFFVASTKLGLGSSAAALVAFAGAWTAFAHRQGRASGSLSLAGLIELHRAFQGGAGSGLDVAACLHGGALSFRLDAARKPHIGSVRLPNSVGFAGVFAGNAAATPGLVDRYRAFCAARPEDAVRLKETMGDVSARGLAALREDDSEAFLDAVCEYGYRLEELGHAMQAEIWTAGHRAIETEANRFDVVYKVSGAGGGDTGLAFASDPEALRRFASAARGQGFHVVDLEVDEQGLVIEEPAR